MNNLKGKVAVVTGGNSGIGYTTAKELRENGATVIITGRRKEALAKAAKEIDSLYFVADQAKFHDIDILVNDVNRQFGTIDILVINAGITGLTPVAETQEAIFDEIMNVNVKGAYFTLSKFVPILNDSASVILVSSTSATTFSPGISVYAASKAAINAIAKVAALELAPRHIRANAVSPGPVATAIMEKSGLGDSKTQKLILSGIPLGRFGKPEDVAGMISYLAGTAATFITGSDFTVDGGQSI